MNSEQNHLEAPSPRHWRRRVLVALRPLGFGIAILLTVLVVGGTLSILSFASGSKEPSGLLGFALDSLVFIYGLPACWVTAPFTPAKSALELGLEIVFWGIVAEMGFRALLRRQSSSARREHAA